MASNLFCNPFFLPPYFSPLHFLGSWKWLKVPLFWGWYRFKTSNRVLYRLDDLCTHILPRRLKLCVPPFLYDFISKAPSKIGALFARSGTPPFLKTNLYRSRSQIVASTRGTPRLPCTPSLPIFFSTLFSVYSFIAEPADCETKECSFVRLEQKLASTLAKISHLYKRQHVSSTSFCAPS